MYIIKPNNTLLFVISSSLLLCNFSYASLDWEKDDLGTFNQTNSETSSASFVSGDGGVVVGESYTDSGTYQVYRYNKSDGKMVGLGTLRADNSGYSEAYAVSTDGRVVVGYSNTDSAYSQAFRHNEGDSKMTGLGTLKGDNTGNSIALAVSADGRVVVGYSDTDNTRSQAFRHNEGDSKMTGLGTLRADNMGYSIAYAVSADGRVVAGDAETESGNNQAFRHNEGDSKMTGLGTLRADNSGDSSVTAISADGRVIVGSANTDNGSDIQAYRHNEGDDKITGIGTLKADNSGFSSSRAVSADGRVVVGEADLDSGDNHAFRHNEGDAKMTDLGTLRTDDSGSSRAYSVSADGRLVVGEADTDSGYNQAFIHQEGDAKMTALGTLNADNSGYSKATAISADGRVVVGTAETDTAGLYHAVIWTIFTDEIKVIDQDNSVDAMKKTANNSYKVLGLYQGALDSLGNSRCQIGVNNYCLGVFADYSRVSDDRVSSGLFASMRLPFENWIVGGAINFANYTSSTRNYDTRGNTKPGIGLFVQYQENLDGSGLNAEVSGAYLDQNITITRDALANTERGKGNSNVSAYQFRSLVNYGINLDKKTQIIPSVAITHHRLTREGYTENKNAVLPATYSDMGIKRTELDLGLAGNYKLNSYIKLHSGIGSSFKLHEKKDAFAGQIDYMGTYRFDSEKTSTARPYAYAGINVATTANSTVSSSLKWQKTDYRKDAFQVELSYSMHW